MKKYILIWLICLAYTSAWARSVKITIHYADGNSRIIGKYYHKDPNDVDKIAEMAQSCSVAKVSYRDNVMLMQVTIKGNGGEQMIVRDLGRWDLDQASCTVDTIQVKAVKVVYISDNATNTLDGISKPWKILYYDEENAANIPDSCKVETGHEDSRTGYPIHIYTIATGVKSYLGDYGWGSVHNPQNYTCHIKDITHEIINN